VTHFRGYGSTSLMEVYPGEEEMHLDAGMVESFILALEFEEFHANSKPFGNELQWRLNNEADVKAYVIERTMNNSSTFEAIDTMWDLSSRTFDRLYLDEAVDADYGYRIKALLFSDANIISPIRFVESEYVTENISVFPNPANVKLTIQFPNPEGYDTKVTLNDFHQHQVWTGHSEGKKSVEVDVSRVPAGIYILNIQTSTGVERRTITIVD
jgi:hypothetical protein